MNNLVYEREFRTSLRVYVSFFFSSYFFFVCDIFLLEAFLEFRLSQATVVVLSGNSIFRAFCVCKQIPVNRLWISPSGRSGELAEELVQTLKGALSTSPRVSCHKGYISVSILSFYTILKGYSNPKLCLLSLITYPHVVPNP